MTLPKAQQKSGGSARRKGGAAAKSANPMPQDKPAATSGGGVRLIGINDIARHLNRSYATVMKYIQQLGLPARKVGGIWECDRDALNEWRETCPELGGGRTGAIGDAEPDGASSRW